MTSIGATFSYKKSIKIYDIYKVFCFIKRDYAEGDRNKMKKTYLLELI